jgi:hypothetical protein
VEETNSLQILFVTCAATGSYAPGCAGYPTDFLGTTSFSLESNTLDSLFVEVAGFGTSSGPSDFSGAADPMITIDPNFADAGDFTLEFSPNVVSTPEPSTLALSFLGIAVLGIMVRRPRPV